MKIKLDFNIDASNDRLNYINDYLSTIDQSNLTQTNLELISNYILWSLAKETPVDFEVDEKRATWKKQAPLSIEALQEQESAAGIPLALRISDTGLASKKKNLNREDVKRLLEEHPEQKEPWLSLWKNIDETEFKVQTYELLHGKRRPDLPIRKELHERLEEDAADIPLPDYERALSEEAAALDGYTYLKLKRNLRELRTQQYVLLDSLKGEPMRKTCITPIYWRGEEPLLNDILPFCQADFIKDAATLEDFSKPSMRKYIAALRRIDAMEQDGQEHIDLRKPEDVRQVIGNLKELHHAASVSSFVSGEALRTLEQFLMFYIQRCRFSQDLMIILKGKINGKTNKEIADKLRDKCGLDYKENYISTIYSKRIIAEIAAQAVANYRLIEFITFGKSVFKRCSDCGRLLPRNADYFNRRASTSDGFFGYCKECKEKR